MVVSIESDIRVTIDDVYYKGEYAIIEEAFIGFEDHGIFSWNLHFKSISNTWGQGTGCYALGDSEPIRRILRVVGTDDWQNLPRKEVIVLRARNGGHIEGMVSKDEKRYIVFKEGFPTNTEK